jgi:hypothetical protein
MEKDYEGHQDSRIQTPDQSEDIDLPWQFAIFPALPTPTL